MPERGELNAAGHMVIRFADGTSLTLEGVIRPDMLRDLIVFHDDLLF